MEKAKEFIKPIIEASDKDSAVKVINGIARKLHLFRNYDHLVNLKDRMDDFKLEFKEIEKRYKNMTIPRLYPSLHELRVELSFLSLYFTDELSFEINKCKIFHEERKTEARAEGILDLKEDEEFNKRFDKKLSATAIRELVGASNVYQEFINLTSYSYGLYQEFHKISDAMKLFNDALASECRDAQYHNQKDAK
jgi:hypothetical protein